ncbi:EamA family transporter [Thalassiella azotivora]
MVGLVAAAAAALLFGVNGTVSKLALSSDLTSLRLVEIRSAGAALCLMAFLLLTNPRSLRVGRRELGFLLVAGVIGIALVQWFYFVAIERLPVGIALLLEYLAPVMVALWVRFVRKEQLRARVWWALGLCVLGLAVVAQVWDGLTLDGVGVLAGVAAAVCLAAYYLTGEHGLRDRDALSLAAWVFTSAALFWSVLQPWWSFPFDVLADDVPLAGPFDGTAAPLWALVLWVVVLGTVAPYALVLVSIRELGSARTGLLGMAEPVLAGLVAWVVLSEALNVPQLLGAAIVLTGIVLAETSRRRPTGAEGQLPEGVAP